MIEEGINNVEAKVKSTVSKGEGPKHALLPQESLTKIQKEFNQQSQRYVGILANWDT